MKLNPIINSLTEIDLYKFSMGQTIFHQFNKDRTKWAFKCRNKNVKFTEEMVNEIKEQIDFYCSLMFKDSELDWMRVNLPWLSEDYIANLRLWHPWRDEIRVNDPRNAVLDDCGLTIEAEGRWVDVSMYEIAILAIVNEVYFAFKYGPGAFNNAFKDICADKTVDLITGKYDIGTFSEFGLRRRYSRETQDWLIEFLTKNKNIISESNHANFIGTSNVFLAMKYGVKPVGTMAHEIVQGAQGHHEYNPAYSNRFVMEAWEREFGVDNGIYLTDCITTDCFLLDFNKRFATLFSGVRHDSADPFVWGDKIIEHYKKLGIDPNTKTLLFSDSLNFEKATKIKKYFDGKAKVAFGIGTYLTNDLGDMAEPLNIVFKMIECNGSPVAKLSDCSGKNMCRDDEYINYLNRCISWRMKH